MALLKKDNQPFKWNEVSIDPFGKTVVVDFFQGDRGIVKSYGLLGTEEARSMGSVSSH